MHIDSDTGIYIEFDIRTLDWDGTEKVAIFNGEYKVVLDEYNKCQIPTEILGDDSPIFIGLIGTATDYRINTNQVKLNIIKKCRK